MSAPKQPNKAGGAPVVTHVDARQDVDWHKYTLASSFK